MLMDMGLSTRVAIAIASLGVGSWLGLGCPAMDRGGLDRVRSSLAPLASVAASAPDLLPPPPQVGASATPAPSASAPAAAPKPTPAARPWPRLDPDADLERAWLHAEGPAHDRRDAKRLVTFTFDDGPFAETTPRILKILGNHGVKATFFVVGRYLEGDSPRAVGSRDVLKDIVRRGHLVGNHTRDHQLLAQLAPSAIAAQIDDCAASIERVTGARPLLFRPPFGRLDPPARRAVAERGLDLVLWSVEVHDMERTDVRDMLVSLKTQLDFSRGGIILLHDIRPSTVPLLAAALEALEAAPFDPRHPDRVGYEIVDLPTYIAATAASPQPYPNREALQKDRLERWRKLHPARPAPGDDVIAD